MARTATIPSVTAPSGAPSSWLIRYYGGRAAFSVLWVALAVAVGKAQPTVGAVLLVAYPAWDCLANHIDAMRNGGLRANPTQALNAFVSAVVTLAIAVAVAMGPDLHAAVGVLGVWAGLSGLLQLSTGVRRWRGASGQWPQILSGAQSCLAAVHMVMRATDPSLAVGAADVAPYAAFGALYFAVSAAMILIRR